MLSEVEIKNVGVIDCARLELKPGLTTITGETGAGKTMVLTGLGLLLGGRADSATVRLGAESASVSGVFNLSDFPNLLELDELDLELEEGELFISRRVSAKGGSRARIQGTPQPISVLSNLGHSLVTVHGQSDQIALKNSSIQRSILDSYGGKKLALALESYRRAWDFAVNSKRELDTWLQGVELYDLEAQRLSEGLKLFDSLNPQLGEEAELDSLIERLSNVSDLRALVSSAALSLRQSEMAPDALTFLGQAQHSLENATAFDTALQSLAGRVQQLVVLAGDIADECEMYLRELSADPAVLSQAHARRASLRKLLQGRAANLEELISWAAQARQRLEQVGDVTGRTKELESNLAEAKNQVLCAGEKLSRLREDTALELSKQVTSQLAGLAMGKASFKVELRPLDKPRSIGLEEIVFLLQPHPQAPARPLSQGASGGELSRVMLAIEVAAATVAGNEKGRTFIFDEVDSGVGGQAALEVGKKLSELARTSQVIVVTHLAQVAAFADTHILLEKRENSTSLKELSEKERVDELGRMLSGQATPKAARAHAVELIKTAKMAQSIL
ncbi:DNA repair protein RecN [Actinomycetaceae bacterium TAE3-ERU4]|nr:DNA repair protein RecN [Actinomycetaceae bacterium TAE3-ERU4]